jgi:hypothetical protein
LGQTLVARLSSSGDWLWVAQGGGAGTIFEGRSIALAQDEESAYITGTLIGNNASFGSSTLTGKNGACVVQIDLNGSWGWASASSTSVSGHIARPAGIATSAIDGSVVIGGQIFGTVTFGGAGSVTSDGSNDLFVAKATASGEWTWVVAATGSGDDNLFGLTVLPDDSVLAVGYFGAGLSFGGKTLSTAGNWDVFSARAASSGTWLSAQRAGGSSIDLAYDIAAWPGGGAVLSGYYSGVAQFGSITLPNSGSVTRTVVARLGASGEFQ